MSNVLSILETLKYKFPELKIGIAGSYARGDNTITSDLDIVIDRCNRGNIDEINVVNTIMELFNKYSIDVNIIWLDVLKSNDEELDLFAKSMGLDINLDSAYKQIMGDLRWV